MSWGRERKQEEEEEEGSFLSESLRRLEIRKEERKLLE